MSYFYDEIDGQGRLYKGRIYRDENDIFTLYSEVKSSNGEILGQSSFPGTASGLSLTDDDIKRALRRKSKK